MAALAFEFSRTRIKQEHGAGAYAPAFRHEKLMWPLLSQIPRPVETEPPFGGTHLLRMAYPLTQ
jgi:hypothetical protein